MRWKLPPNQIHIWRASLKLSAEEIFSLASLLNPQEKAQSEKFIAKHAKDTFIIARGTLRQLLANYLDTKPQDLLFKQNQYGKPYIDALSLQFNISHSHDWALFAFVLDHPIGIDIELMRDNFDFAPIAKRFFSKQESNELFSLPKEKQLQAFYNCWVAKEAFIKAIGRGIFFALDKFSVEISNQKTGQLQLQINSAEFKAPDWSLEIIDPADKYAGALVTSCKKYKVMMSDLATTKFQ